MEQEFTVLENRTIGRNLYKFRKIREKKALEVAEYVGISEAAYTKYERGESKITVDVIQKVAECLKVDPLQIIATSPGHFVDGSNATHSVVMAGSTIGGEVRFIDDKVTALITTLIEGQIAMNEKIMEMLSKK